MVAFHKFYFLTALFSFCQSQGQQEHEVTSLALLTFNQRMAAFNKYFLYTRHNLREPRQLQPTIESITQDVNLKDDTVIIVHGLKGSGFSSLNIPLKDAFLSRGQFNVICMDWVLFANLDNEMVVNYVPAVGLGLGQFLKVLMSLPEVGKIHIVGYDYGAHIAGVAGQYVKGNISRITGLDPSAGTIPSTLDASSAKYVEIIHTNAFGRRAMGMSQPIGHVDFYVNGGAQQQPGCMSNICSHVRSWELFESSILNPGRFLGHRCNSVANIMANQCNGPVLKMGGINTEKFASGNYHLLTKKSYPY